MKVTENKLEGVFASHISYVVPAFQRPYVWKKENVERLFLDLWDHFVNWRDNGDDGDYFLGSIICLKPDASNALEVIDGQQRLTTLIILLAAIRALAQEKNWEFPGYVLPWIFAPRREDGKTVSRCRMTLHYPEGNHFLQKVVAGNVTAPSTDDGYVYKRLFMAYETLLTLARKHFKDQQTIEDFFNHVSETVSLITLETDSLAACFKLFETINARGVKLSPGDLFKNSLFSKIAREKDRAEIEGCWAKTTAIFRGNTEHFMMFIKDYALMSHDKAELKIENSIAKFASHGDPVSLVRDILQKAEWYASFRAAKHVNGDPCGSLTRITKLGGNGFRIHLNGLMTVMDKRPDQFNRFMDSVERYLIVAKIVGIPTQTMRNELNGLRARIVLAPREEVDHVLDAFDDDVSAHKDSFENVLRSVSLRHLKKGFRRYLLALIYHHIENAAHGGEKYSINDLMMNAVYHEEHVLPQTFAEEAADEGGFQAEEYESWTWRFGNLLLLDKLTNFRVGQRMFSSKRIEYAKNSFLFNQTFQNQVDDSATDIRSRVLRPFKPISVWTKEVIEQRTNLYIDLLVKIMALDKPGHSNS